MPDLICCIVHVSAHFERKQGLQNQMLTDRQTERQTDYCNPSRMCAEG